MPLDADGKETGWLSKWAFQVGALAADAVGRAAIATGYFAATAAMRALFADGFLTEAKLGVPNVDGLHPNRVARTTYDFAEHGGAQGTISLGVTLPDNAIITRAWYEVIDILTSGGGDAATISIDIPTDDVAGIVAAIAISNGGNPWDPGLHEAIQDGTAANFSTKTTAARTLQITVAGGQDITAGKFILFAEYVVSD